MTIEALLLISMFAVWRATYMLQEETGPWMVFSRIQAWSWKDPAPKGGLKDGLRCFYCTSMWISFIPAIIIEYSNIGLFFIYWLAISSGAIFINILHGISEKYNT